jgi:N-acetyl-gamma-glutamyl-phosphate reductase
MIKVSIVGATGYTGEEILKIISSHQKVELSALTSKIEKSERISDLLGWYKGRDIICEKEVDVEKISSNSDIVFLALPHRISMTYAPKFLKNGVRVIDLSADYRLPVNLYEEWYKHKHTDSGNIDNAVYGLPEAYRSKIKDAKLIANPGCYPTSVILAALPVFRQGLASGTIIADSKTGTTGAGRKPDVSLSFAEVDSNMKAYKINRHQHAPEITHQLGLFGENVDLTFVPHLVPLRRGILSTVYIDLKKDLNDKEANQLYKEFYADEPFVNVLEEGVYPQISDVTETNYCHIGLKAQGKRLIAVSCIDNLTKGAAGQAVQNMNILCGFDEKESLR